MNQFISNTTSLAHIHRDKSNTTTTTTTTKEEKQQCNVYASRMFRNARRYKQGYKNISIKKRKIIRRKHTHTQYDGDDDDDDGNKKPTKYVPRNINDRRKMLKTILMYEHETYHTKYKLTDSGQTKLA